MSGTVSPVPPCSFMLCIGMDNFIFVGGMNLTHGVKADVAVAESSLSPLVPEICASLRTWLKLLPDYELQFM